MRERLVDLINEAKDKYPTIPSVNCCKPTFAYYLADILLANGAIFPPYKCGTVVYVLRSQTSNGKNLYMREERIDHYRTFNNRTFMIFESGGISVRNDEWSRSVFATQEEAEQALKGDHQ